MIAVEGAVSGLDLGSTVAANMSPVACRGMSPDGNENVKGSTI